MNMIKCPDCGSTKDDLVFGGSNTYGDTMVEAYNCLNCGCEFELNYDITYKLSSVTKLGKECEL